ncbi:MAG: arginine repressor, partial [Acidobacteriota bacterium]
MPTQTERHRALLQLLEQYAVTSQTPLLKLLRRRRIVTTQATLSRDINRLGLVKVRTGNGTFRYGPAGSPA